MRIAPRRPLVLLAALSLASFLYTSPIGAQVSLTTVGTPYTQNFDGLANAGTNVAWTDNTTIAGWYSTRTTYNAGTGSSNAGSQYSFGVAGANPVTDRAIGGVASNTTGNFFWAVRLVNNTGATITSLDISYNGEQWRDGGAAVPAAQTMALEYQVANSGTITDADTPSTGWTASASLTFSSPTFVNTGGGAALDGNLAANRTAKSASLALTVAPGQEVWIRWRDNNDTGNDHGLAADDLSITPQAGPVTPTLNISDVTLAEGDPPGTTTFTFAVTLTSPAGPGGVTFDIATADGTAQDDNPAVTEDNDYVAQSLTGQSIAAGSTGPYNFSVTVNRDTTTEPNETFFVNVTNITGANAGDTQGQGTINNDDVSLTPIHDIQGPGASSPIVGSSVTTRGIVTGRKSNGFFIQEPDASVDADPATSEGILVFTSSAPPAAAAVGNYVQVTGTVAEFVPGADPFQPPLTELTSPTVVQLSTGNPLPAAIPLTATFPDPAGPFDQLERLEGMRVSVSSLTVTGPTLGTLSEANATSTSTGVFYGVVTGVPRPFREAGIQAPDPAPSGGGSIPPIPRFDSNPERIRVDSDALTGGPLIDVNSGAVVTGLVGPLDYSFRTYTIDPDPGASIGVAGGATATSVSAPTGQEFTVGTYNMQRFYDAVDDPGGDTALTPAAVDKRLAKASLGIRNNLGMPDILGVVEVENLTILQTLATRISTDAAAASQPDPQYVAYLVEGNDIGGIDVGFLVKTAEVAAGTPRVEVVEVQQELDGTLLVNPDSSTSVLNDRPPLRLNAIIHHPNGASFPVTVIVNHLRSLNDVNSEDPGSNGWSTDGARVRAKRQEQAEDLANLVQARQTANPLEHIILVGDFNAFEFNDGLVDSMDVIAGTPVPDNETAVPGDGVDLVNPNFDNLFDTPPAPERYGYIFDGNAQNLDHVLVNAPLITDTVARRIEHPRINTDYADTARNDGTTPVRLSDHDPVVAFFQVAGFATADLSITKTDGVTTAVPGGSVTYTITASNAGPDPVTGGTVADTFPAVLTCTWTCVGAGGGTCTAAGSGNISDTVNLPAGGSVTYTASCSISASATGSLVNTATVSGGVNDPDSGNNSATDTDVLTPQADLAITKTDGVTTVDAGGPVTYTITASNSGPSDAPGTTVADTFPTELTCTWTCVGAGGGTCTAAGSGDISDTVNLPAGGSVTYTASCTLSPSATGTLSNTATVAAPAGVTDPNPGNNSATDIDTVNAVEGGYFTLTPCRVVDTRSGSPLQDGVPQTFTLHGACGIPATATAVVLNVTAVLPTGSGDLTIYASDATPPGFATLPFNASRTRALFVVTELSPSGEITVQASVAGGGTVDVVVDVMGYFE